MAVPPEVPIVKFFSPSKADRGLIEFHNSTTAAYAPLDEGAAHPNTRDYPGFKLGKQFNLPSDHKWIVRLWVTDETDNTWWAWAEKFSGDANAFPIFIREYREPRKTYTPLAKGQPLKSVYRLTLATAGTGYEPGTLPALTFTNTGTGGTGAAGHAIVNPDGTIAALVLDDGGDGYNTAPTFTIAAPPTGTTATGTAVIQPATALLVAEEAQRFPPDSEFYGLYLQVARVYETLPGPYIPFTRYDENLGPIQGRRRAVLNSGQATTLGATSKKTYEGRDASSIVSWEIEENWSDGTGSEGNPAYPIGTSTDFERDGVKKTITRQLKPVGDIVTDETLAGGTLTRRYRQAYPDNPALGFQVTETITVIDDDLLDDPSFTTSIPNLIPEIFRAQIPTHVESHIIEGVAEETTLATGEFEHSERQLTPLYKEVRSTVLDDIGTLPITITGQKETNEKKQVVTVSMKLCVDSTTPTVPTALIDVDFKKLGNGLAIEITKTIAGVFDKDTRSIAIPDVTPAWAKALNPTTSTSSEAAATSVSDPTLSTGQIEKRVQRTTEKTVQTDITARDAASLPKTRTNKRLTTEFGGGAVNDVQTHATGSQSISAGGLLVLDSEMEVLGDGTSVLKTSTQSDGSWPVLHDYDIDPETGQTIHTTYQVVAVADAATATIASGVVTKYKHIDKWRSLKIVETYSTPADYEEQRFGAFAFPALFAGSAFYHWTTECGAFIEAGGLRSSFSASVPHRVVISFSTTRPATIDGLTLIPQTLVLGKGVQLPQDIICDSDAFTYVGACSGTVTFGGSDPDYSTYTGSIQDTEQLITGESVKVGKSGMYRTTSVYVTMK